jgi:transcriptional regulator with XRE-family HTH domain
MTPAQCRAARALLDWTQPQLAAAAGLGLTTLADFESGARPLPEQALGLLSRALQTAGVQLIPEDGGGAGVRFRRPAGRPAEGIRPQDLNSSNDD